MDKNCLICLCETDINLRHNLCCQCGKLICDSCLDNQKVIKMKKCPYCSYRRNRLSLTKLFRLTERENIEKGLVYNIIGCHLIESDVKLRGIECLKMADTFLSRKNLNLVAGEAIDIQISFGKENYSTDLTCVSEDNIKEFLIKYSQYLEKESLLEIINNLFKKDYTDICMDISGKFMDDDDFLIYIIIIELHDLCKPDKKILKEDKKILVKRIEILAEKEISLAILEAGRVYMFSNYYETDYKKAHDYFIRLPEEPDALFLLSKIYRQGLGIEKDVFKSFEFLYKSYLNKGKGYYNLYIDTMETVLATLNENMVFNLIVDEEDEDEEDDDSFDDI